MPKERQIVDRNESEGIEPRNCSKNALGQGLIMSETNSTACAKGEYVSNMPGSESMVGNRIVYIGTWESLIVPREAFNKRKTQRRKYDDTAVGLTHIRGVGRVMPAEFHEPETLEWVSSRTQRDAEATAIH